MSFFSFLFKYDASSADRTSVMSFYGRARVKDRIGIREGKERKEEEEGGRDTRIDLEFSSSTGRETDREMILS